MSGSVTRRAVSAVFIVLTVVCSLVAFTTNWNSFIFAAMIFAIVPLTVTIMGGGERPGSFHIRNFVERELHSRFGMGAVSVKTLKPGLFSILYGRRGYVPFRIEAILNEPFFETVVAPIARFEGITPRRIEAIRRQAESLVEKLGAEVGDLRAEFPDDPFTATYVVERWQKGTRVSLSGAVTAAPLGNSWNYTLEHMNFGRRDISALGRTAVDCAGAVMLGTWGGDRWIAENVSAWQAFSRKLASLQGQVESAQADNGERAVKGFFRSVRAGAHFHGVGRSASGQHEPTDFFLEIRSVDAADRKLTLALRNDGAWENARSFHASVAFDASEKVVWVHARTQARDACENAGPLIGAPNGFALDFHFRPETPPALESFGGDVSMWLAEISRATLRELRAQIDARNRGPGSIVRPGAVFSGSYETVGDERREVTLAFVESSVPGQRVEARVESGTWSGLFSVVVDPYATEKHDLVLEPIASPADGESDAGAGPDWKRLLLSIVEGGLRGEIETVDGIVEIGLSTAQKETPARPAGNSVPA
jgi:hypothetical protein